MAKITISRLNPFCDLCDSHATHIIWSDDDLFAQVCKPCAAQMICEAEVMVGGDND